MSVDHGVMSVQNTSSQGAAPTSGNEFAASVNNSSELVQIPSLPDVHAKKDGAVSVGYQTQQAADGNVPRFGAAQSNKRLATGNAKDSSRGINPLQPTSSPKANSDLRKAKNSLRANSNRQNSID